MEYPKLSCHRLIIPMGDVSALVVALNVISDLNLKCTLYVGLDFYKFNICDFHLIENERINECIDTYKALAPLSV